MLNKNNVRELAYVVTVDDIKPIPGRDRVESAIVGGWTIMVKRGVFKPGDLGIYFEVDSLVPAKEPFMFLESKHFKIKVQKFKTPEGQYWSQGLLMHPSDFGWTIVENNSVKDDKGRLHSPEGESRFLTEHLEVEYAEAADNIRKGKSSEKLNKNQRYQKMMNAHPKFAKTKFAKWCMKRTWAKKILYIFLKPSKKEENAKLFPNHLPFITKSDEERVENIPFVLRDKDRWVKTVKIDGTSSLFLLERKGRRFEYYVCSRNVRQADRNQSCYHDDNVYWEVEDKYKMREALESLLNDHPEWNYVAIQGETAGCSSSGSKIQGDPHKFGELRFFAYNFITSDIGRWGSVEGKEMLTKFNIPWVPIISESYILPDDMGEFKLSADGPCEADGASGLREGYVYRRAVFQDGKINSFKNVSREYLVKH